MDERKGPDKIYLQLARNNPVYCLTKYEESDIEYTRTEEIKTVLQRWKKRSNKYEKELQVGRNGADDGSRDHYRMEMLDECIYDLEYAIPEEQTK